MPSPNSHADVIRDWMLVLEATERSPEVQAEVEKERLKVAQLLAEVQTLKARQVELTALRQQATQQLKATVVQGKEAVMQFRAILKAKFGPRNERLVQFNMAPLRKRSRKLVEKKPTDSPTVKPVA